jgi:hypothetical protein
MSCQRSLNKAIKLNHSREWGGKPLGSHRDSRVAEHEDVVGSGCFRFSYVTDSPVVHKPAKEARNEIQIFLDNPPAMPGVTEADT